MNASYMNAASNAVGYKPIYNALDKAYHQPLRVGGNSADKPAMVPVTNYSQLFRR